MLDFKIEEAAAHWSHLDHLLREPRNDAEYDAKVEMLDTIIDTIGDDEDHYLASLAARVGDLIETYDQEHRPIPEASGAEVLRYLMAEHGISQSDLPEVGAQPVVSAILSGKRQLNWRQICALADRFGISTDSFR
ncbi:helix-turn-helix domain-containing protein [Halotalea alkalilenta]|uniref:helix-turn-helix domain-containing protein n=1 Tax=Halotalea alkalilenta TaxID=376489 RepID=UPI0004829766|nr:transcriptional regulator [Halotalea alkalilenta]